jgi:hypothetical protein
MVMLVLELPSVVGVDTLVQFVRSQMPRGIASMIDDCMQPAPADRCTAKEVLQQIDHLTGDPEQSELNGSRRSSSSISDPNASTTKLKASVTPR